MKFINSYRKFMYGRYGVDELYNFLLKIYLILFIINIFINNKFISILELFLVVIIMFRFFSKNINVRKKENQLFLKLKNSLKLFNNYKDGYIYKKCPKCKKLLKLPLPYKRGIKSVICPKCNKKFRMLVMRREKVEIISNKK